MKIVTHNSSFHTDDIFAVAVLLTLFPDAEVIRSRDQKEIDSADYVVDVGMVYDPAKHRFDHHMLGGAGERKNGIPYASFGLVWKEFGEKLAGGTREAEIIDKYLIQSIDSFDNGVATCKSIIEDVKEYVIGDFFESFVTEQNPSEEILYKIFMGNVEIAKGILSREIQKAKYMVQGEDMLQKCYEESPDKRILELPQEGLPWYSMAARFPEPLFVIYPRHDGNWGIKAVRDITKPYGNNRKSLPEAWAAKKDEELQKITGVPGAIFAHGKRFMAAAKSKEDILKLANLALNE